MSTPRRNIWSYRVLRLVAYDRCRVAAWWFAWRYGRSNAAYLRRLACLVEQNARMALKFADRGYVMETGKIALQGNAIELLESPEVQATYLGK